MGKGGFKRRRFKRGKKSIKKKVAHIQKEIGGLMTKGCQGQTFHSLVSTAALTNFIGVANTSAMDVSSALGVVLTGIPAGVGQDQRPGTQVYLDSIRIRLWISPDSGVPTGTSVHFTSYLRFRVIIVKVKMMPQDGGGNYRHPTIKELLTTSAVTISDDLDAPLARELVVAGRQSNYRIIRDRRFSFAVSGGGGPTDNVGSLHMATTIRPKGNLRTTYDGSGNTVANCAQNHYLMYVLADIPTLITRQEQPDIFLNVMQQWHY